MRNNNTNHEGYKIMRLATTLPNAENIISTQLQNHRIEFSNITSEVFYASDQYAIQINVDTVQNGD